MAQKRIRMTLRTGRNLLRLFERRPFFGELVEFMTSVQCRCWKARAPCLYRDVIGATDPSKAADARSARSMESLLAGNSVHGSDANCRPPQSKSRNSFQATKSSADLLGQRQRIAARWLKVPRGETVKMGRGKFSILRRSRRSSPNSRPQMQQPAFWVALGKIM